MIAIVADPAFVIRDPMEFHRVWKRLADRLDRAVKLVMRAEIFL